MKIEIANKKEEKVDLDKSIWDVKVGTDHFVQAVNAYLKNQRTDSAKAKRRGEVRGGGRKPWKQKGTGRARHGSIRSPIWTGGGVAHGPTGEQNSKVSLNKKMRNSALRAMLSTKLAGKQVIVVDNAEENPTKIRKENEQYFADVNSTLYVVGSRSQYLAFRNMSKVTPINPENINVYELAKHENIVIDKSSLSKLEKVIKGNEK